VAGTGGLAGGGGPAAPPVGFFAPFLDRSTYGVNLNWDWPADPVSPPGPGQDRIGPHPDFGTGTVLGRRLA
jgi:hypothetical protein